MDYKQAQKLAQALLKRIKVVGFLAVSEAAKRARVGGFEFGDRKDALTTLRFYAKGDLPFGVTDASENVHAFAQDDLQDYEKVVRMAERAERKRKRAGEMAQRVAARYVNGADQLGR